MNGTPKHGWDQLPRAMREMVAAHLGADVVDAATQQGGFTPGVAARLRFADGSTAFVKAVATTTNAASAGMHRREAEIVATIGSDPDVPRLLAVFDDGDWVTLVFELIEGEHPRTPWSEGQLTKVLSALQGLHERLTPSPVAAAPLGEQASYDLYRWQRFAAQPERARHHGLKREDVEVLAALAEDVAALTVGDTLLHGDLRADQVLLSEERVVFLDWPHACEGPGWADTVLMVPGIVQADDGLDIEDILRLSPEVRRAPRGAVLALLSAIAGYLLWQSDEPPPPNLPTVRAYQLAQARAVVPWLLAASGNST